MSRQLLHALATLGIKITHSRPRRPQGRGKVERLFETVRAQFLVEVTAADGTAGQAGTALESAGQLEELFAAWVHQVYHQALHSGTGQTPRERFHAPGSVLTPLEPAVIDEAFLWQDFRTVTKTGTVSLHGNRYQAGPALAGRKAELLYNPLDLTCGIRVRYRGTEMGTAIPHVIGRHSHPQASPAAPAPAQPTGIDYLRMVAGEHRAGQAAAINFHALRPGPDTARTRTRRGSPGDPPPGRAALPADLAALLTAGADGACADMAAVQLLTDHHYWLTRADFTTAFITTGPSPLSGRHLGHVRWKAAARALAAGQLPCTGSEAAILQIAASLAAGLPVRLRDAITGLDHANLTAVTDAIMTAGGHPPLSPRPALLPAGARRTGSRRPITPNGDHPHARQDPVVLRVHENAVRPGPGPGPAAPPPRPRRDRRPAHLGHHRYW